MRTSRTTWSYAGVEMEAYSKCLEDTRLYCPRLVSRLDIPDLRRQLPDSAKHVHRSESSSCFLFMRRDRRDGCCDASNAVSLFVWSTRVGFG